MSAVGQLWLTIVGGPNGSGKSTITSALKLRQGMPVIDPDAIARELQPDAPAAVAVEAGREAIRQQTALLAQGASFAVETTLSG